MPMKLDRLNDRLDRVKSLIGTRPRTDPEPSVPGRYQRLTHAVGGKLVEDDAGTFCLVRTLYPIGHRFGNQVLEIGKGKERVTSNSFSAGSSEGDAPISNLLFIDTETTGLGGAGAVAFLIGCASVLPTGFEIRQYLLPDYADEAGMLERVLLEFTPETTLVSYNGLVFDMNLIRDRMILNRVAKEVPQAGHFDLLHSARRLYRRRLRDCSLTNIEREIFEFFRDDDIPGHLIPSVYFDWLHSEETRQLESVLEHNRLDILALFFLLLHVDEVFARDGASLDHIDDRYSLSRVYARRKQIDKVTAAFDDLAQLSAQPIASDIAIFHALAFKRAGDWDSAEKLWRQLARRRGREAYEACIELAKYHEHRTRDITRALDYALRGKELGAPNTRQQQQLAHRLSRLKSRSKG